MRPYETQRPSNQRVVDGGARAAMASSARKTALADARLADDERGPTPTCGDDVEQRGQALQLLAAPDHGAVEPDGSEPAPAGRRGLSADDAKGVDRLGLALDLDLAEIVEVERVAGRRRVISVITIVPGSAAVCIRAATFTASPSAVYSYRRSDPTLPTMTGPLLMPARGWKSMPCVAFSWRANSSVASSMSSAARMARSGSSSCATGAPKNASSASPWSWAIVPS